MKRKWLVSLVLLITILTGCSPQTYAVAIGGEPRFNIQIGKPVNLNVEIPSSEFDSHEQWAMDFLAGIGNPTPSADTVAFVVGWQKAEGGSAAFNNLNTTQPADGSTDYNSVHVKNFVSREQGLAANIQTIQNGFYPHILHGLQTNDPDEALNDQELNTWGTGKAGVEASWIRAIRQGAKHNVTDSMEVGATFETVSCDAWGNQPACQHLGDDMQGADGDPVYAPFDGVWTETNEYQPGDPSCPRCLGQYIRYVTATGDEMYLGHLQQALQLAPGTPVKAGTVVGRIREDLMHTHWQCRAPDHSLEDCFIYFNNHQ